MLRKFISFFFFISLCFIATLSYADEIKYLKVDPLYVLNVNTRLTCLASQITLFSPTSIWYTKAQLTVKNNCTTSQVMNGAVVSFQTNSNNLIKMWNGNNTSTSFTYVGNVASTVLNIVNGDPLLVGQSLIMYFGINLAGKPFDLVSANNTLLVVTKNETPNNGEIDVTVDPKNVVGITGSSEIDITGGSLTQPYVITNTNWSTPTTYKVTGLSYGTYTITALPIGTSFTGEATPSTVSINSATPVSVKVTYQPIVALGSLQVNLEQAPMIGLATTVDATLTDTTANQNQVFSVAWGSSKLIPNLTVGHNFKLTFPQVTNGLSFSNPNPIDNLVILQNRTTTVAVTYQTAQPVASQTVTFTISGLPTGVNGTLSILDSFGNKFTKTLSTNGQVNQALPTNDTFVVTATAPNLNATVNPTSFTLKSGTTPPAVSVQFSATPPPINISNFYAYADIALQATNKGLVPPQGANMVEAFIRYNPNTGKSDLIGINQGDAISQIIKNTPNTVASIGGTTSPYPWDFQSPNRAVADIEALIDYYHFIGIDFDIEGAALDSTCNQEWVAAVAMQLRKDRPNLILTLTLPDPVNGFNTSSVALIKKTLSLNNNKMLFNWINKLDFNQTSYNGCTQTDTNLDNNCLVISATTAAQQLASILGISQANQYIGEIFMIPVDDKGNALSLTLATQVATTLKNKGITHMGYWRLQNDTPDLSYGNMFTHVLGLS